MNILGENKMCFEEVIDRCTNVPTREEVVKNDTAARSVWKPISHSDFTGAMARGIEHCGLQITDSAFALNKTGHLLVGGFKVKGEMLPIMPGGVDGEFELFARHSNNMSHSLQINAGVNLMVCTNGCMTGEMLARHKHTNQFDVEAWARDVALAEFIGDCYNQTKNIQELQHMGLSDGAAAQCILEATSREILPLARAKDVWEEWKNPVFSAEDFEPGTAWKLYGDITHVAQKCSPQRQLHVVQQASPLVREFAV